MPVQKISFTSPQEYNKTWENIEQTWPKKNIFIRLTDISKLVVLIAKIALGAIFKPSAKSNDKNTSVSWLKKHDHSHVDIKMKKLAFEAFLLVSFGALFPNWMINKHKSLQPVSVHGQKSWSHSLKDFLRTSSEQTRNLIVKHPYVTSIAAVSIAAVGYAVASQYFSILSPALTDAQATQPSGHIDLQKALETEPLNLQTPSITPSIVSGLESGTVSTIPSLEQVITPVNDQLNTTAPAIPIFMTSMFNTTVASFDILKQKITSIDLKQKSEEIQNLFNEKLADIAPYSKEILIGLGGLTTVCVVAGFIWCTRRNETGEDLSIPKSGTVISDPTNPVHLGALRSKRHSKLPAKKEVRSLVNPDKNSSVSAPSSMPTVLVTEGEDSANSTSQNQLKTPVPPKTFDFAGLSTETKSNNAAVSAVAPEQDEGGETSDDETPRARAPSTTTATKAKQMFGDDVDDSDTEQVERKPNAALSALSQPVEDGNDGYVSEVNDGEDDESPKSNPRPNIPKATRNLAGHKQGGISGDVPISDPFQKSNVASASMKPRSRKPSAANPFGFELPTTSVANTHTDINDFLSQPVSGQFGASSFRVR